MPYLPLIEMGIGFLEKFLSGLKWGKAPAEVLTAVQAAYDSLVAHKLDMITRSNIDSLRG